MIVVNARGKDVADVLDTLKRRLPDHGLRLQDPPNEHRLLTSAALAVFDTTSGKRVATVRVRREKNGYRSYDVASCVTIWSPLIEPRAGWEQRAHREQPTNSLYWGQVNMTKMDTIINALVKARDNFPSKAEEELGRVRSQINEMSRVRARIGKDLPPTVRCDHAFLQLLLDSAKGKLEDDMAVKAGALQRWLDDIQRLETQLSLLREDLEKAAQRVKEERAA